MRRFYPYFLRVLFALTATASVFVILPFFDFIGNAQRKDLRIIPVDSVTPPPSRILRENKQKTIKEKRLKKPKLKMPENVKKLSIKPSSINIPLTSFQSGFGDIAISFDTQKTPVVFDKDKGESLFKISDLDSNPRLLFPVKPVYPFSAKQKNIEGYVDIEFIIFPDGTTGNIRVIEESPEGVFAKSAIQAVSNWKFTVPHKNSKAVKVIARQRIKFKLE